MNAELIIFRDTVEEILKQRASGLIHNTQALDAIYKALIEYKKAVE